MRYNFDDADSTPEPDRRSLTPKEEVEWLPLEKHPVFAPSGDAAGAGADAAAAPRNLLAWDGSSRLYFWDNSRQCLHRISIRLGEPEPTSILAASPSKELQADAPINFAVEKISINRNGSALLLMGSDGLSVMYLYGRSSSKDKTMICRTISVGSQIYFNGANTIRALQVMWHPYSDTHLGILSSDSVFRLFDLSANLKQPEQEFYLQPAEPGQSKNAASLCPADFTFGDDHLWDRFSVFILFTDGSIHILCPVVPFGSVYKWECIQEIYGDAQNSGLKSVNPTAVQNSNLAISWLEATFPELSDEAAERASLASVKARPYALFDASLSLQGPLHICQGREEDPLSKGAECEGRAIGLLYNLVSKDSILVTAWGGGQLQIDALADEIQPVWNLGTPSRVRVDSYDRILGVAMICELSLADQSILRLDQPSEEQCVWLGQPPPLLRLAIVDLALPRRKPKGDASITMFPDPVLPERMYSLHEGGIDSIVLHFLPFTSQTSGKEETVRAPSVIPVLSTCCLGEESSLPSPLCGSLALSDSFGYSWIVAVTSDKECIVVEMKTWELLLPVRVNLEKKDISLEDSKEVEVPNIISKELLSGPKLVVPQAPPNLRSVAADSIEGRSILHQYFKLFHENYVEYAHKVYFELQHHAPHLKRIIDDQHARLGEAQQRLLKVEEKQKGLDERNDRVIEQHNFLDQRLRRLRNLPGVHKKPLSRAEREFKAELDQFGGVELHALHSSIEALTARLRRCTQSMKKEHTPGKKGPVQDAQISLLKSSLEKLSLVNSENLKKVKLVELAMKGCDTSRY
ncbi:nuclear pore complex protein NUP88 [Punica granatum]|uniref:Uncharacterized protein n=2 Tax=Punica granatum TaxID=22663 RepID=A0A218XRI0_PUNGR|nr:nuclear pore complex protein NUP88 [Punica granatum]OWM87430.1 hypothetical protein CDL15_Pgr022541 [Punica granatum]PKI46653.1 hypothetical protein CRG98_032995 [Punica granatum]